MKTLLIASLLFLTGCTAMQPYARADREGYEVGIRGEWQAVREEIRRLWRVGETTESTEAAEDFKAVR